MKLLIARFTGGNHDHPDQTDWLIRTLSEANRSIATKGVWHGVTEIKGWKLNDTPITMSRNQASKYALDRGFDYLFMLDNDTIPDIMPGAPAFLPEALDFMAERREDEVEMSQVDPRYPMPATIAAPYCGPPPKELVYVFEWTTHETGAANPSFSLEMIDRNSAAIRDGIQEVAALPTGCILYDARVFAKLPPPWFEYEWTDQHQTHKASTEDVYQTRNASLIGLPQFVHWSCWAGHAKGKMVVKPHVFTPDDVHVSLRNHLVNTRKGEKLVFNGDRDVARSTFEGRRVANGHGRTDQE